MLFKLARTSICIGVILVQMPNHLGLFAIVCFAGGFLYISIVPPQVPSKPVPVNVWQRHYQRNRPPSGWVSFGKRLMQPFSMPVVLVPATGFCMAVVAARLFNPNLFGFVFITIFISVLAKETAQATIRK